MRSLLVLLPLAAPIAGTAQTVVSGGGGHHADAATRITYTIGEPVIATAGANNVVLTQGFHQPWADITTLVDDSPANTIVINVYPNPVSHTLHIACEDAADAQQYFLHDAAGRLVNEGRITSSITDLDMEAYASGGYILRVLGNDTTLKSFKISITH